MSDWELDIDWSDEKAIDFLKEPRTSKMIKMAGANKTILDVGCYTGDISLELKNNNNSVIGLDCNSKFVARTMRKNIMAFLANFETGWPIKSNCADLIFAGEVIEHIYHTEIFLKESARVLKPQGELLISTPNLAYWGHRIKLLFGTPPNILGYESGEGEVANPGHVRYYTINSLKSILNKYGFDVVEVKGSQIFPGPIGVFLGDIFPSLSYHIIIKAKRRY